MNEQEHTSPPRASARERPPPPAQPVASDEGEEETADERTSPFPYAEKFDEWVADETGSRRD